ncbi:hypothetical protein [Granulosicoccus antarcticus]|uniref:Oxidoreductase DRL-like catalytic domain-containing protein n=1 Tax=Granulosicoccus antarcticus IMCC3135 TaxID=1192854 RepID=A0A2Z2P3X6_9GAMM|nr:hypothetical protein [Granulosicoccus antarcticus]ASJ74534.1 hypothetical protein IMCC3135_22320 [Granulosicoccus antarcticus IMCC3135]
MNIWNRLQRYESENGAAPIAIIGAGYVAGGVVSMLAQTPGVRPAIIINRTVEKAVQAFIDVGYSESDIVVSDDASVLANAIDSGKPAVTQHYAVIKDLPVRALVEATGAMDYGTEAILYTLEQGIHVVSYNAEVDALLGWLFHDKARLHNVVYTIADGDQPGAIFRLKQQVEAMGFEVDTLLNCKRYMDTSQTPSSGAGFASRDATSNIMTTAFGDGTKMQVEQAVVANATGIEPSILGMHGIKSTQENILRDCAAKLPKGKQVDYTLGGDFGAGVAVIAHHPNGVSHKKALSLYKMGNGPDYFFFRPFHLVHLELPATMAQVLLDNEPLVSVDQPHVAEVIAMAKKDLSSGEKLDCIGGYTAYGLIESTRRSSEYLPVGLVEFATVTAGIAANAPISLDNVKLDHSRAVVKEWMQMRSSWSKAANIQMKAASGTE